MKNLILVLVASAFMFSCGDSGSTSTTTNNSNKTSEKKAEPKKEEVKEYDVMEDLGIGPIDAVFLGKLNDEMVTQGKADFKALCSSCHKVNKRFTGPNLEKILDRRTPEWVMNMILNPEEMIEKNPTAKALYEEFLSPMANQNVSEEEARAILEYFRTI